MQHHLLMTLFIIASLFATPVNAADELRAENVLLTLIEHVELPAKEPGAVLDLAVREGEIVEPGRELAVIEDDESRMAASKAERELTIARTKADNDVAVRFARKAHEVAAAEYRRAQESMEKFHKSVSATEMDQLRLTAEKALLEIEQAELEQSIARLTFRQKETELESAKLKLKRHRLTAPFAGMVVEIKKHRGEWANPGDSVLRLVRLDRLRVEAFVPARDYAAHLQGRQVTIIVDVPRTGPVQFAGTVVFVSPEVNPVNGQVRLWAEVDNRDLTLRPGQAATVVIDSDEAARRLDRRKTTR